MVMSHAGWHSVNLGALDLALCAIGRYWLLQHTYIIAEPFLLSLVYDCVSGCLCVYACMYVCVYVSVSECVYTLHWRNSINVQIVNSSMDCYHYQMTSCPNMYICILYMLLYNNIYMKDVISDKNHSYIFQWPCNYAWQYHNAKYLSL